MAISIYKASEEIQNAITQDYKNNYSLRQLQNKYNIQRATISLFLEEKGIKKTTGNHYRKYFHDEDYFESIDNEHKAYWLGFLFADGYILESSYGQKKLGFSLAKDSEDALENFKKDIQATNPITWEFPGQREGECRRQPMGRILLTSDKTTNDLIDKGMIPRKSRALLPPDKLPESLFRHFVRGFLDGNGSIGMRLSNNRLSARVSFTTTYDVAEWLKNISPVSGGSIIKDKRHETVYSYSLGGNNQVRKFLAWLYDDATIFLERKYHKYLDFLFKYDESQGTYG